MKNSQNTRKIVFSDLFLFFSCFYFLLFHKFSAVILVPELFRKLRETPRKNSDQVWSKSVRSCMSYDQKTKICVWRFSDFFNSNCQNWQFLTSDSNSTGRNPPRAHLRMSENLHFEISAPFWFILILLLKFGLTFFCVLGCYFGPRAV